MKSNSPKLSVIMPVYNRMKYLKESIESVLNQTFSDFELIIVDDGSEDKSVDVIKSFTDDRIVLIQHDVNKGVASARNTGYLNAKGEYIVVSDSDDINHLEKFEKQIEFLENNSHIDIVGCFYQHFNENGNLQILKYEKKDSIIKISNLFWLNIAPTLMFRKKSIIEKGYLLHDESFKAAVDLEWCGKQPLSINCANIQEVLYYYRRHSDQLTIESSYSKQKKYISLSRSRTIKEKLNMNVSDFEIKIHDKLCDPFIEYEITHDDVKAWVSKLINRNNELRIYNRILFSEIVLNYYKRLCEWMEYDINELVEFKEEIEAFDLDCLKKFKSDNDMVYETLKNKSIVVFGTLFMGRKLQHKLIKLNLNFRFYIDNYRSQLISKIEEFDVFSQQILKSKKIDCVIITVESDKRFEIKSELEAIYPDVEFLLLDNFLLP